MRVRKLVFLGIGGWVLPMQLASNCFAQVVVNGATTASQGETAILHKLGQYPWWQTIASATIAGILAVVLSEVARAAWGRLSKKRGGRRPDARRSAAKTRPSRSHPRAGESAVRVRRNELR